MNIFLSYVQEDIPFAKRLSDNLSSSGFNVLLDSQNIRPGDSIIQKIIESIKLSEVIIIILSKNSINSKWLSTEIAFSISRRESEQKGLIIPIIIDDNIPIPFFIKDIKYLNFSNPNEWSNNYEQLVQIISEKDDNRYEKKSHSKANVDYLKAQQLSLELERLEYIRHKTKKNQILLSSLFLLTLLVAIVSIVLVIGLIKLESTILFTLGAFIAGIITSLFTFRNYKDKEIKILELEKERLYQIVKNKYPKMSVGEDK